MDLTKLGYAGPVHLYLCPFKQMRPKARGLAQHGGPPGLLEESVTQQGVIFLVDGQSMPPALTDHTPCVQNVHKTPSRATSLKEGMAW
jgi:hypothetical protein